MALMLLAGTCVAAASPMRVSNAWARPTPPGVNVGAVYFRLENLGSAPDRLVGLSSEAAASVEIHRTVTRDGVMSMQPLAYLDCLPGQPVEVSPGRIHVMLLGLKAPLAAGGTVPLKLAFRDAGMLSLSIPVEARD